MNKTQSGIKMLKAIRDQLAQGDSLEKIHFCNGISCSECPIYSLCAADKSGKERYEYLERQYSKYLDNTFTEGEAVLVSVNNHFFTEATFLYYSPKTKLYWVTESKREACAYKYCKPTEKPKKITMSEIEEKFGCRVVIVNE